MDDHWILSDTHFRHGNIYNFTGLDSKRIRDRFADVYEGDAFMIQAWNDTIKPEDHVWHLGDFCFGSAQQWEDVGKRLNGHKRIVPGNHDKVQIDVYRKAGFQKLCGAKELQVAGLRLLCTHYPVHESSLFKRDACIHGHIHEKEPPTLRHYNVSVERIDYRPLHVEELAKRVKLRLEQYALSISNPQGI